MSLRRVAVVVALCVAAQLAVAQRHRVSAPPRQPTFSREVVRIFQEHCQSCHHPGGLGPFTLTTYQGAYPNALLIRFATLTGEMPPWKPVKGCGEFKNEMHLSATEIATIGEWVKAGAPEGDPADLPPPLEFNDDGWYLGQPDLELKMPAPFSKVTNADVYRMVPLNHVFDHDMYVTAVEVHPQARANVHHILMYADSSGVSDQLAAAGGPDVGYEPEGGMVGFVPSAFLGTWIGGQIPFRLPSETAIKIPAGSKVVLELHYHPHGGRIESDQTSIGLYFAREPIHKLMQYGSIDNENFEIPAGDPNYRVTYSWTVPRSMHIFSIGGHMHFLGKRFDAQATLPDGSQACLLSLDHWDPAWQGLYEYVQPFSTPAGTRIDIEGFYDNSAGNPRQFNFPPINIPYGGIASREMCFAYFIYTFDDEVVDIQPPDF